LRGESSYIIAHKILFGIRFISTILQDGKIDEEDAKAWWRIIKEVLVYKLPSAGGFSLGFLYGARYA
jgi:hypothetical protein